jgi:hypothetical protein
MFPHRGGRTFGIAVAEGFQNPAVAHRQPGQIDA